MALVVRPFDEIDKSIWVEFDLGEPTTMHTYVAPMQSLNQFPGATNPAKARSVWIVDKSTINPAEDPVLPAIEKQVRTNNIQPELWIKDEVYWRGGILQVHSIEGLADTRAYGED